MITKAGRKPSHGGLGKIPISVTIGKPTKEKPKGGVYDRLEKLLATPKESWNSVIERLLDFYESSFDDGK